MIDTNLRGDHGPLAFFSIERGRRRCCPQDSREQCSGKDFIAFAGIPLRTFEPFETYGNASLEAFVLAAKQAAD